MPPAPVTVPALLAERAATRADHELLICDDDVLTYADAERRSAELAKSLLAAGVGAGTHVGLLHPNGSAFVVGWLAAARIGAVTVPLSTFSTAAELRMLLVGADIEVLLAASAYRARDFVAALQDALPSTDLTTAPIQSPEAPALRRVVFDAPADAPGGDVPATPANLRQPVVDTTTEVRRFVPPADAPGGDVPATPANLRQPVVGMTTEVRRFGDVDDEVLAAAGASVRPSDRMVIVHTSGSTSRPKGVIHQHGPLIEHLRVLNELRRYDEDEILYSASPFFWIGGFAYSLLGTLVAGATLVCSNASDASATLDLLERTRPTMVNGFAAGVAHLAKDPSFPGRDLSSIRRGNLWPIMPEAVRPADPELRHNMLGMTETGSVCLASDDEGDQPEHRRGSFGRPVPGFETRIVDPDSGADLAAGEVGELWLRGPALMEGYYGRERHETFTADGWYRTGDLFHVDADGFHYFTGRHGDMIKTAGANVAPREVEAAIVDATGLVAHVLGLDDAERGQVVAAAVRVPPDRSAPEGEELRTLLRERLSAYKVPRRYLFLSDADVPMLSSGKLDSQALKDLFGGV